MRGVERFLNGDGEVTVWPSKGDDKRLVIEYLSTKFDMDGVYAESEVNAILKRWHTFSDWPLLRRELFERGFFDRNPSGSEYRRTDPTA